MSFLAKIFAPEVLKELQNFRDVNASLASKLEVAIRDISEKNSEIFSIKMEIDELKKQLEQKVDEFNVAAEKLNEQLDLNHYLTAKYESLEEELHGQLNMSMEDVRKKYDALMENSTEPWAIFEVMGFDEKGVKINFNWNPKFVSEIHKMGFVEEDDQESVQQFFALMKMLPASYLDDPENNIS